jgi:uncharacterized protein (DUF342 family)
MDKSGKKIQNESGYQLTITADKMKAFVCPLQEPPPEVGPDSLKGLLETEGVLFGVSDDAQIIDYLASKPSRKDPWVIAQGKPVKPGRPPQIKYHFDIDPLKVGTVDESGVIDFKNRGEIPHAEEGKLLAEIIPGKTGTPGRDIYGNSIQPPEYADIKIICGKGAQRSEKDPLKIVAQTNGRPEVLEDGTICVSDVIAIPGDLGIETGHVEFDGHIEVEGTVQQGYRVKGKTLKADEILQANLEIEGDIIVSKGIIGANIQTDGTIRARHIRDAVIDSLEDINVETEVYESEIETNGAFNMEGGTILSSTVSAMGGINVAEIGSPSSPPCKLIVGVDNRLEKKIAKIKPEIEEKEKEEEVLKSQLSEFQIEEKKLEDAIGKLAQKEDSTMVKGRSLKATLEKFKEANDRANVVKVIKLIEHLNLALDKVKQKLETLLEEQDQLENKIQECKSQIKHTEAGIQELQDDIRSLTELAKMKKHSATVNVSGTVHDQTLIEGPHASFIVKENLKHMSFQEVRRTDPNVEEEWVMIVSSLK